MNRWLKLVGVLLIAAIAVAVVSPDFDLQPALARVSSYAKTSCSCVRCHHRDKQTLGAALYTFAACGFAPRLRQSSHRPHHPQLHPPLLDQPSFSPRSLPNSGCRRTGSCPPSSPPLSAVWNTSGIFMRVRLKRFCTISAFAVVVLSISAYAQRLDGSLSGTVEDPSGAVVIEATVTATNQLTGVKQSASTTSAGNYAFPNLLIGMYTVEVEAPGFLKYTRKDVDVLPNQAITANARLRVAAPGTIVDVVSGSEVVQTSTSQLSHDFGARAVTDLPSPGLGGGPLNLALLAPNTTTQGAGVQGEGGSIGGARPRLNSFNIDGVDDNRVDVTGHTSEVIPEAVADFNLVTNMFSAELGHSAGGQFNIVTKSGTNNWHGSLWEFNNNRNFNAMDNLEQASGLTSPRRVDRNRTGLDIGGPLIKDRLFIYGAYQFSNVGLAAAAVQQLAPTAAGLAQLNSMAANDSVRSILSQFPTAPVADATPETVNGVSIPIGTFQPTAPSYLNQHDFNINSDLNVGRHQLRGRFLYDRQRSPNVNLETPQ